jgi:sugar phosphate isomerase/epimerase
MTVGFPRLDAEEAATLLLELGFEAVEVHLLQIGPGVPGVPVFEGHAAALGEALRDAGLVVSTLNGAGAPGFEPLADGDAAADELARQLRLAAALGSFWAYRGYPAEGRPWLAGVLALPAPSPARARALLAAGIVCREDGHDAEAADWLAEARAVYAQLGDAEGVARAEAELALTRRRGSPTP